jgi:hypothetical protein
VKKRTKDIREHITSEFSNIKDRLDYLKGKYDGETAYICATGPSFSYYEEDFLKSFLKDKLVMSIKQTYNTIGSVSDFHFINFCNLNNYIDLNEDVITCWSVWEQNQIPVILNSFPKCDLLFDVYKLGDETANIDNTVALTNEFDLLSFDNGVSRPWGPGTMYELSIPLAVWLGCKEIITIGWDMYGDRVDELKQMKDENKGLIHNYFESHHVDFEETLAKVNAKEILGVIDSTEKLKVWLDSHDVDIKVTDPNYDNPSHVSIQRVLL